MPIVFACAMSHAPGVTAWPEAAPAQQLHNIEAGFASLKERFHASKPELLLLLTSEHWANFFLDHIGAFCIGRGETFTGPVEPWLKVPKQTMRGNPQFAKEMLEYLYGKHFEPSHAHEMAFDHGSMVPINFLAPSPDCAIVPLLFNTLAPPRAEPSRCLKLGRTLQPFLQERPERIAVVATGGMSHDPGEKRHGFIDTKFDSGFLEKITAGDLNGLAAYTDADLLKAGAGTLELLSWITLAGIMSPHKADLIAYEPVVPWATGMGMVAYV